MLQFENDIKGTRMVLHKVIIKGDNFEGEFDIEGEAVVLESNLP